MTVDRLIEAWWAWEQMPRAETTTNRRLDVLAEMGLPCIATTVLIADARRAGMSISDAVQTAVNELTVLQEVA